MSYWTRSNNHEADTTTILNPGQRKLPDELSLPTLESAQFVLLTRIQQSHIGDLTSPPTSKDTFNLSDCLWYRIVVQKDSVSYLSEDMVIKQDNFDTNTGRLTSMSRQAHKALIKSPTIHVEDDNVGQRYSHSQSAHPYLIDGHCRDLVKVTTIGRECFFSRLII
ncbi:11054_t:CDS:2 [Paraglomus occultum]|uniref:11054_t:CDS:1 n=1 Tax=Paraglomus occultum TaxID=144539 RepID=A0A9N9B047_9GLOM|nr:11054_t:CDS:2 [Paraglomus occultum]